MRDVECRAWIGRILTGLFFCFSSTCIILTRMLSWFLLGEILMINRLEGRVPGEGKMLHSKVGGHLLIQRIRPATVLSVGRPTQEMVHIRLRECIERRWQEQETRVGNDGSYPKREIRLIPDVTTKSGNCSVRDDEGPTPIASRHPSPQRVRVNHRSRRVPTS